MKYKIPNIHIRIKDVGRSQDLWFDTDAHKKYHLGIFAKIIITKIVISKYKTRIRDQKLTDTNDLIGTNSLGFGPNTILLRDLGEYFC